MIKEKKNVCENTSNGSRRDFPQQSPWGIGDLIVKGNWMSWFHSTFRSIIETSAWTFDKQISRFWLMQFAQVYCVTHPSIVTPTSLHSAQVSNLMILKWILSETSSTGVIGKYPTALDHSVQLIVIMLTWNFLWFRSGIFYLIYAIWRLQLFTDVLIWLKIFVNFRFR